MSDPIREGIQRLLDLYDDGWTCADYVVAIGLERVHDGELQTIPWYYAPPQQAEWVTDGLIIALDRLHAQVVEDQ